MEASMVPEEVKMLMTLVGFRRGNPHHYAAVGKWRGLIMLMIKSIATAKQADGDEVPYSEEDKDFGELDAEKTISIIFGGFIQGHKKMGEKNADQDRWSNKISPFPDAAVHAAPTLDRTRATMYLWLRTMRSFTSSAQEIKELKHPNLCYCSVGQREANRKEFVLRARKAEEKNKFVASFQSFRPSNLATYAACRYISL
ncbi:hypothetical protein MUK42_36594 [Musa troglodytarum]|uniref:Uncharacterized protein n=1 Tax=Musa troglodytarum TaxID=320322 RepID=A0A9E7JAA6_9LILI|nr:hypothetical protein MUK42_36594 [Musa troglodytarum]